MTLKAKILSVCVGIAALPVISTAIVFNRNDRSTSNGRDVANTPLGALFHRASAVSDIKRRMGELRDVYPALVQFAQAHQDDLPRSIVELRPLLPQKLAYLDDQHWELPAVGKMSPLVNGNNARTVILLQEKSPFPERPKIILYGDGHLEYRK
ncbi:MAG TPA: hypothetical protein VFE51_05800 [Verrucomicrobiae bacterium]|nr:hypothetical protein [Verrucomicrobiae bacterium]